MKLNDCRPVIKINVPSVNSNSVDEFNFQKCRLVCFQKNFFCVINQNQKYITTLKQPYTSFTCIGSALRHAGF